MFQDAANAKILDVENRLDRFLMTFAPVEAGRSSRKGSEERAVPRSAGCDVVDDGIQVEYLVLGAGARALTAAIEATYLARAFKPGLRHGNEISEINHPAPTPSRPLEYTLFFIPPCMLREIEGFLADLDEPEEYFLLVES